MPRVRVATFNVENLFARFKFHRNVDRRRAVREGWQADAQYFTISNDESKRITADLITNLYPDILGLQEVENLDTLKRFRDQYLGGREAYPYAISIDGNDRRLIDVAILSRFPIVHVRSYQHLWLPEKNMPLFSRDCLEADILITAERVLTVYINHLKSFSNDRDPCNGRRLTQFVRQAQARAVLEIVKDRFGAQPGGAPFIIMGDFNDYLESDELGETAIAELVLWDQVENVVDRLPVAERWTHYFKGNPQCNLPPAYHQIDYLLLSRALAAAAAGPPIIERAGLPERAERYQGPRLPAVGYDWPKASDHCPVAIDIDF